MTSEHRKNCSSPYTMQKNKKQPPKLSLGAWLGLSYFSMSSVLPFSRFKASIHGTSYLSTDATQAGFLRNAQHGFF